MIRGIIFNKDGTLIDFHALWDSVGISLASEFLKLEGLSANAKLEGELSRGIGVFPGRTDPSGAFACGTYDDCGAVFAHILIRYGYAFSEKEVAARLREISDRASCADAAHYREVCSLKTLFGQLRALGIKIGLVTCDTQVAADYAVNRLGLREWIDFVEGAPQTERCPKPHRDPAFRFCAQTGVGSEELAIVGDSMTDMLFAKNAGAVAVGVLSGVGDERELGRAADVVIPNVAYIQKFLHMQGDRVLMKDRPEAVGRQMGK
jgi:phosphoglycolate phosphatase-like HAD superfamily hydrolase